MFGVEVRLGWCGVWVVFRNPWCDVKTGVAVSGGYHYFLVNVSGGVAVMVKLTSLDALYTLILP